MKRAGKIFLGGGGDENQSFPLDRIFTNTIREQGPILYLPMAQEGDRQFYNECLRWFTQTMKMHGIPETQISMWTDFSQVTLPQLKQFGAIYIGGGMTGHLCQLMKDAKLQELFPPILESGVSIYGGSAGAIALGEHIYCVPEEMLGTAEEHSQGLGVIKNTSFRCHYRVDDLATQELCLATSIRLPTQRILAIPETSGLIYEDGEFVVVGQEPVFEFHRGKILEIPNNSIQINP